MPKLCGKAYEPIRILFDQVLVEGGYARTAERVPIRKAMCSGTKQRTFLRLSAKDPWLTAAAIGSKRVVGLKNFTNLVSDLRELLGQACDGKSVMPTDKGLIRCRGDVAAEADVAADDLMDVVSDEELGHEFAMQQRVKAKDAKRARYFQNASKGKIVEIEMPARAPESGEDTGTRIVRVLCEDRKTIWLCSEDVSWAVVYLRDQLMHKGLTPVRSADIVPEVPQVEDRSIEEPNEG